MLLSLNLLYSSPRPVVPPKKPSKFTPAHDAVAAALLHKHHLIIHIGAGPMQWSQAMARPCSLIRTSDHPRSIFKHFSEEFFSLSLSGSLFFSPYFIFSLYLSLSSTISVSISVSVSLFPRLLPSFFLRPLFFCVSLKLCD